MNSGMIDDFIKYIKSIGFIHSHNTVYNYENFTIHIYKIYYDFYDGSHSTLFIQYNDLNLLEKYFKRELRSIKLKELLR